METLVVIYLILVSVSVATSQSVTDSATLLQCLVREGSNPQNNISTVTYIPTNSSFTAVLRRRIPTSVSTNPPPQNPSPSSGSEAEATTSKDSLTPPPSRSSSSTCSISNPSTSISPKERLGLIPGYDRRALLPNREKSNVLGFPAGLCTTLGVGGHFSGGGYGNLMRKYGLSVDNVVGSGIVDSNWEYTPIGFRWGKTVSGRVGKTVGEGAVDLLMKWQSFAHSTDRNLFVKVTLTVVNGTKPGEKTVLASFIGMYLGRSDKTLNVMNRDFPELKLKKTDCTEMRWIDSVLFWAGYPGTPTSVLLNPTVGNKLFMKRKSDYVKSSISRTGLGLMIKKLVEVEKVEMNWNPYGGRMGEIRVRGHRSHIEQAICSTLSMS
ncbi:unnamed protein product [Microthlaspi erraticum]|uniref:Uncharacterized protein n=1 Tax=Microthlaspi erraticum TaxID=1685480 RepID=A0A6D2HIV9_9BRAS|nr:unnamed protein product [Microthlaspi erraticum]